MTPTAYWQCGDTFAGLTGAVIPREQWAAFGDATVLLEAVSRHQASAASENERLRREALAAGYQEGLALGRLAGLKELLVQSVSAEQFVVEMSDTLVALAEQGLRQFLETAELGPHFRRQIQQAVQTARHDRQPLLRVAPERRAMAEAMLQTLDEPLDRLSLIADPALQGDDVVLECEHVIVDGRLQARIDRWRSDLRQSVRALIAEATQSAGDSDAS